MQKEPPVVSVGLIGGPLLNDADRNERRTCDEELVIHEQTREVVEPHQSVGRRPDRAHLARGVRLGQPPAFDLIARFVAAYRVVTGG